MALLFFCDGHLAERGPFPHRFEEPSNPAQHVDTTANSFLTEHAGAGEIVDALRGMKRTSASPKASHIEVFQRPCGNTGNWGDQPRRARQSRLAKPVCGANPHTLAQIAAQAGASSATAACRVSAGLANLPHESRPEAGSVASARSPASCAHDQKINSSAPLSSAHRGRRCGFPTFLQRRRT